MSKELIDEGICILIFGKAWRPYLPHAGQLSQLGV